MYKLIRTQEDFLSIILDGSFTLFCDTETCKEDGKSDGGLYGAVRLFQLYQKGWRYAIIIDCRFIPLAQVLELVAPCHCIFHNSSYDLHTINNTTDKLWLPIKVDDTIYMSRLTFWDKGPKYDFYSCLKHAGLEDETIRSIDKKANQKADWGGLLTNTMLEYAAYDVLYLSLLYDKVKSARDTESYKLDIFNLKYAVEYSRRGIPTDRERVKEKLLETTTALEKITAELHPLNPNSSPQCCKLLGTSSSDNDTLTRLDLEGNEIAGKISKARSLSKMVGFAKKYDRDVVKGYYNPSAAITGRFSCTGGDVFDHSNLQQIPHMLLECLAAISGRTFVYKDYAGLELRMAVAWIAEPTMERMIREGVDLHTYTASVLFQIPMDKVTNEQRDIGKTCNFLLIYGGGIARLRMELMGIGILLPFGEVKKIRLAWLDEYKYFDEWHGMTRKHMDIYGYMDIQTALGKRIRTTSTNDALNFPISGSSSEVTKKSLEYLKARYVDENLISTIHDSNTLMPIVEEAELWRDRLNECMIDAWYYVIKGTALPDLPMPPEAEINNRWEF